MEEPIKAHCFWFFDENKAVVTGSTFEIAPDINGGSTASMDVTLTGIESGPGTVVTDAKLGTYDFIVKAVDEPIQIEGQYVSAEGTISATTGTIPTISGMCDYEVRGTEMAVTAYHKNSTPATVSVPASVSYRGTTFTVDAIDSSVFAGDTEIMKVVLSDIEVMEEGLFDGDTALRGVSYH